MSEWKTQNAKTPDVSQQETVGEYRGRKRSSASPQLGACL